ncbi:MAG: adenosylcobinamide-GDP ribazoletransferase [Lachnospiraceae bacterium]|nr:adenosylcobinamide-GDP ribazoletransferase [Lachnospiraceae bacterium]
MPKTGLKTEDLRHVPACLPIIGALLGLLEALLYYGIKRLGLWAAGGLLMAVLPLAFTGGIHADGFLDVSDALSSYASREKKLEILKDPHIGAFAVIRFSGLFLSEAAFCMILAEKAPMEAAWEIGSVFILSRLLASFGLACCKGAKEAGLFFQFASAADRKASRAVLVMEALILSAAMISAGWIPAFILLAGNALLFWRYIVKMKKEFGGITGDTEGWLICVSEGLGLALLALGYLVL